MAGWAWSHVQTLPSDSFVCGYCGADITSEKGYSGTGASSSSVVALGTTELDCRIYICHKCNLPTYRAPFLRASKTPYGRVAQAPGAPFGAHVSHISDKDVEELYEEARRATSARAYTATVLCCRKLLMHIAVAKGAQADQAFTRYVDYLESNHWAPPLSKVWLDQIRSDSNEANHQIVLATAQQAQTLLGFIEMLLRFSYELPAKARLPPPEAGK